MIHNFRVLPQIKESSILKKEQKSSNLNISSERSFKRIQGIDSSIAKEVDKFLN